MEVNNPIPRLLACLSCAVFAGTASAATTRTTFRGDSILAFWNSSDACVSRSIDVIASRDSTGGKATTYNTFIFFFEQDLCANTLTFATSNATSPPLTPHGAKWAAIQGSATIDGWTSDPYGNGFTQFTHVATVDLRFDAAESPTHSRSSSSTFSPTGTMIMHANGNYAPSIGTGSIMLEDGTQLLAGPSDYADYGVTSSASLTITHK